MCGLRGEEPTLLLEQKSPSPCSCRVRALLLWVSGPRWPFHSSLPQQEHMAVIHTSKKLPVLGASSLVRQDPNQPEMFHGLLVPPQTISAPPGAHGLCSTPWKAALVLAELTLPPGEPLSSSPWAWGAALVTGFLTETSYQQHAGMMEQLQASAHVWWSQEPCKPTATFRGTSSTRAAGKFFEGHPSTVCPFLLDHKGRRVCAATQGSVSAPQASRGTVMEGLCRGVLLPPGLPLTWHLHFVTGKGGGGGRKATVWKSCEQISFIWPWSSLWHLWSRGAVLITLLTVGV